MIIRATKVQKYTCFINIIYFFLHYICLLKQIHLPLLRCLNNQKIILQMEQKIKQAKLHGKYRSPSYRASVNKNLPWLNLSGLWLAEAGFTVGQRIEIAVTNKQLIIKAL
jgi:hypothetical protein